MSARWEFDFETLMRRLLDGAPGAPDLAELEQLFSAHPEAIDAYVRLMTLDTHARQFIKSTAVLAGEPSPAPLIGEGSVSSPSPLMGEGRSEISSPVAAHLSTVPSAVRGEDFPSAHSLPPPASKSPVLGFLDGVIDYVNHSRMLMFWLVALLVTGWFAFQLGLLMMGRARPGGAPVAGQPVDPNFPDVSHPPGGSFADPASPRQGDLVATGKIALVTALVDCRWRVVSSAVPSASTPAPGDADTNGPFDDHLFHAGSELSAGQQLDLVRGLAEITFRSGARIVLNGPAHFTVGSAIGGKLQIGKLTARVPHDAHGFTVNTPAGKVVDLGTEFGVAVAANHTMDVEVFVGEVAVDASPADGQTPGSPSAIPTKPQKLTAGHGVHVEAGKPVATIPLDPKRFVRGLGPRDDSRSAQAAYANWMRSLKPAVWFRMEGQNTDRVLHDEMGGPNAKLLWDGPGNPFVEGRLGNGLWLRGPKLRDYAIVSSYPQAEHGKLSVSAWVYADSHPSFSTIAGNWKEKSSSGQFCFGVNFGRLAVGISQSDGKALWLSEGGSGQGGSGQAGSGQAASGHEFPLYEWQHVAFTTDGRTLLLYRQGHEVASIKHAGLLHPSPIQGLGIGVTFDQSGTAPGKEFPAYWDGKLDELVILNDTLTVDSIRKLATFVPH